MWGIGQMVCIICGHEDDAVHVWKIGSEPVECPECHEYGCMPADPEAEWLEARG